MNPKDQNENEVKALQEEINQGLKNIPKEIDRDLVVIEEGLNKISKENDAAFKEIDAEIERAIHVEIPEGLRVIERDLQMFERELVDKKEAIRKRCLDLKNDTEEIERMKLELDHVVPGALTPGQKAWIVRERGILEAERDSAIRGAIMRFWAEASDVVDSWKSFDNWLYKVTNGTVGQKFLSVLEEKTIHSVDENVFEKAKQIK